MYVYMYTDLNKMWLFRWGTVEKKCHKFVSQFPCVVEQKVKLFDPDHSNKSHTSHHRREVFFKISSLRNMSVLREAKLLHVFLMGFPNNNCLCFPIYPQLRQRSFTTYIDPSYQRSQITYNLKKQEISLPESATKHRNLFPLHISYRQSSLLADTVQRQLQKRLEGLNSQLYMRFLASNY